MSWDISIFVFQLILKPSCYQGTETPEWNEDTLGPWISGQTEGKTDPGSTGWGDERRDDTGALLPRSDGPGKLEGKGGEPS